MPNKNEWKLRVPGLLVAIGLTGSAVWVSRFFPQPGAVCLSILLGMLLGNLLPSEHKLAPGLKFAECTLLPWAIALMGTELELHALVQLGAGALLWVFPPLFLALLLARPLGRFLGLSGGAALLLGVGNSICGSSAILAASPALPVEKHDVAISVAAVNLLGIVGMFFLPFLAAGLGLSGEQAAGLIGGSLQAVGQVAASGYSVSAQVGDHALVFKMLRVLMIGPVVMLLQHLFRAKSDSGEGPRFPRVPGYILGFMGCAVAAALLPSNNPVVPAVRSFAGGLMAVAMVAIGAQIRIRALVSQGPKVLLLGGILSLIQAGAVLLLTLRFPPGH